MRLGYKAIDVEEVPARARRRSRCRQVAAAHANLGLRAGRPRPAVRPGLAGPRRRGLTASTGRRAAADARALRHRAGAYSGGHGRAVACRRGWSGTRVLSGASSSSPARVQHQLAETARRGPVREAATCPSSKKTQARRASASTAHGRPRGARAPHEMPALVLEWRRSRSSRAPTSTPCRAREPSDRPRAHDVQSGGGRDGATEQQRSEPAEHPDPDRARPRDPGGVRRRTRLRVLISADYSQIELRVLAHLSGDAALIDAFRQGVDIHDRTADARVRRRRAASTSTNCGAARRSSTTRCCTERRRSRSPRTSACRSRPRRSSSTPTSPGSPVRAFIDRTLAEARAQGVVRTLSGRRRLVPELTSRNGRFAPPPNARRSTCPFRARPPTS